MRQYSARILDFTTLTLRILCGAIFVFSGFAKLIDPLGGSYKITEYLTHFGLEHSPSLSITLSILLACFEFFAGTMLLLGTWRRIILLSLTLFMAVMTPLTLYLAIENPIHDCGCFGEALQLTNWETFLKNLFLLAAILFLGLRSKHIIRLVPANHRKFIFIWCSTIPVFVSCYCLLWGLPLLDFTPYQIGQPLPTGLPQGAQQEFESILIYQKDGVKKEFTLDNYPADDSGWEFVDATHKPINTKANDTEVKNPLQLITQEGDPFVIPQEGYMLFAVMYDLPHTKNDKADRLNDLYQLAEENHIPFYALTTSGTADIIQWIKMTAADYPFLFADEIPLKTIVRSNPGLVLIKDGKIAYKWANHNIPDEMEAITYEPDTDFAALAQSKQRRTNLILLLVFLTPIIGACIPEFKKSKPNEDNPSNKRSKQ